MPINQSHAKLQRVLFAHLPTCIAPECDRTVADLRQLRVRDTDVSVVASDEYAIAVEILEQTKIERDIFCAGKIDGTTLHVLG